MAAARVWGWLCRASGLIWPMSRELRDHVKDEGGV